MGDVARRAGRGRSGGGWAAGVGWAGHQPAKPRNQGQGGGPSMHARNMVIGGSGSDQACARSFCGMESAERIPGSKHDRCAEGLYEAKWLWGKKYWNEEI